MVLSATMGGLELFCGSVSIFKIILIRITAAEKYPDQTKPIEQVKALQVKEKFGSLRFYYSGGDEKISAVVDFVGYISKFICETTGKNENIGYNSKGWTKTHHQSLSDEKDFHFVDSEELRQLNLNKE